MSHNDHSAHAESANGHSHNGHSTQPDSFDVRVLRQDGPGQASYWQRFRVPYERDMNVISALQRIAAIAKTVEDDAVAPVAWDCNCLEEVCGAVYDGHQRSCPPGLLGAWWIGCSTTTRRKSNCARRKVPSRAQSGRRSARACSRR